MICDECGLCKSGIRRYETETDLFYFCPKCKAKYESLIKIRDTMKKALKEISKECEKIGSIQ